MSKQQRSKQQQLELADVLDNSISSKCHCGRIEIQFPVSAVVVCPIPVLLQSSNNATSTSACTTATTKTTTSIAISAVDCHCASCRRYHIAAFASYVIVLKSNTLIIDNNINNNNNKRTTNILLNGTEPSTTTTTTTLRAKTTTESTTISQKLSLLSTKDDKSYETYNDTCSGIHISNNNFIINNTNSNSTTSTQQQQPPPVNVKRVYCKYCSTKLYTEIIMKDNDDPSNNNNNNNKAPSQQLQSTTNQDETKKMSETILLVNMGPLQDTTIPKVLSNQWKRLSATTNNNNIFSSSGRQQWAMNETAVWTWAIPECVQQKQIHKQQRNSKKEVKNNEKEVSLLLLQGGCTCKLYQYEIDLHDSNSIPSKLELQHCYCQLCRRLSGSAFMTWISIYCKDFKWIVQNDKTNNCGNNILKRYTNHGQRHVCTNCHGAITIVYDKDNTTTTATNDNHDDDDEELEKDGDDDDDWEEETDDDDDDENVIWIAAGSLDTNCLPPITMKNDMNTHIERVAHICCSMKQSWYTLPKDGMERINDAS